MQSGSHFCLKFLENTLHYCLVLLSAQSFNQLSLSVANSHVAPNKTQLMSIKIEKKKQRGKKGAKHNQMADMPTHEKWQFGACINY